MLPRTKRGASLALGVTAALGLAAVAVARDTSPQTDRVRATFDVSASSVQARVCRGDDGRYFELRGTYTGSITSASPWLTGDLALRVHAVHNDTTQDGTVVGTFVVRDPATARPQVVGELAGVESADVPGPHGFMLGRVAGDRSDPAGGDLPGHLFANFTSAVAPGGHLTGQLGGNAEGTAAPAVIQEGHCTGPWRPFP